MEKLQLKQAYRPVKYVYICAGRLRFFLVNDIQNPSTPLLFFPPRYKSGQIGFLVNKDAQCSETDEKIIIRYLFMRNGRFCTGDS